MPHEHTAPQPVGPVTTSPWVDRGLLLGGAALTLMSLVSDSGVVQGLSVALAAGLLGGGLGVLIRRTRSDGQ